MTRRLHKFNTEVKYARSWSSHTLAERRRAYHRAARRDARAEIREQLIG